MNICFLINQVAPDGAPTLLLDIVRNTEDPDISYTLCVIEGDRSLIKDFENEDVEVVDFRAAVKFDPRALGRMACFFYQRDFDILHAHLPYSQTIGRIFGRLGGHQTIVSTQHNVPDNYHPITRTLERLTRSIDARTVTVSEGVEQAFTGTSARYEPGQDRQWCTIYNGIDVEGFHQSVEDADSGAVREHWSIDANVVYLNISRYVEAKVIEMEPDSHLLVVGWGPLEDELKDAVNDNGLDNHVTITGKVPAVHAYYALADVFVSSSVFEGMPIAHLEAMAAGLPLIATDILGVDEVVLDEENGLLIPPEQPNQLADAMIELRNEHKREQYGKAGLQRAREHFSIQTTVEKHLTLYRELLERDCPHTRHQQN